MMYQGSFPIRNWYMLNVQMLQRLFDQISIDDIAFQWVLIHRFPLPSIFDQYESALLIRTPGVNIENYAAYDFYLNMNLSRKDLNRFRHIFDVDPYNDLSHKGYSKLSFHLTSFTPAYDVLSGDTLVDIVQAIYNFLAQDTGV